MTIPNGKFKMDKYCVSCAEPIVDELYVDESFHYEYGDMTGYHEDIYKLYECADGCQKRVYVECESDLARRYFRRYGTGHKHAGAWIKE